MARLEPLTGQANGFAYAATVPASRPTRDYTPRLINCHAAASVPLEAPFILWHEQTGA